MRATSTAYSGTPPARSRMVRVREGGRSDARSRSSSRIAASGSRSRWIAVNRAALAPHAGRWSMSSGRARAITRTGCSRVHVARCSTKSSSAGSAHWRSSNTSTTGDRSATRSKKRRQAAKSSSRSKGGPVSPPRRVAIRGSIQRRSPSSRTISSSAAESCRRAIVGLASSETRMRRLTISATAAKVIPSP